MHPACEVIATDTAPRAVLTAREQQVLNAVMRGERNREIAQALQISVKTVEHHRATLMRKAGARTAADLAARVLSGRLRIVTNKPVVT
ncbi:LuxR C-terminal-related transcriptional regulator [Niveibacterium sp.]|uniref:LuxR C-terminal-related transcriptional regulator n=1 Tax=Niveibacterium sp. TaxID=2017444 RepID=UPI0035B03862